MPTMGLRLRIFKRGREVTYREVVTGLAVEAQVECSTSSQAQPYCQEHPLNCMSQHVEKSTGTYRCLLDVTVCLFLSM